MDHLNGTWGLDWACCRGRLLGGCLPRDRSTARFQARIFILRNFVLVRRHDELRSRRYSSRSTLVAFGGAGSIERLDSVRTYHALHVCCISTGLAANRFLNGQLRRGTGRRLQTLTRAKLRLIRQKARLEPPFTMLSVKSW